MGLAPFKQTVSNRYWSDLVENRNNFFVNSSADFQLVDDELNTHADCTLDSDMFFESYKAYCALKKVKSHKSVGPSEIPNRVLRDFAFDYLQRYMTSITARYDKRTILDL